MPRLPFDEAFHSEITSPSEPLELPTSINTNKGNKWAFPADSRSMSSAFEIACVNITKRIADRYGYVLVEPVEEKYYPDFALTPVELAEKQSLLRPKDKLLKIGAERVESRNDVETILRENPDTETFECLIEREGERSRLPLHREEFMRVAVDVKTTYRQSPTHSIKFALGSRTSFLHNSSKNIQYDYKCYAEHWIIGIVYRRRENRTTGNAAELTTHHPEPEQIRLDTVLGNHNGSNDQYDPPVENVSVIVNKKWKIAGENTGSGNTNSIASISTPSLDEFREGDGVFESRDEFKQYWRYYSEYNDEETYTSLEEFYRWRSETTIDELTGEVTATTETKQLTDFNQDEPGERVEKQSVDSEGKAHPRAETPHPLSPDEYADVAVEDRAGGQALPLKQFTNA